MKKILIALFTLAVAVTSHAQRDLWLRANAISPDGSKIVFSYHGNLFIVPSSGGQARQLTSNSNYDSYPVWSPDGKSIAFSSDRLGGFDVFLISERGGTPKRLTTHSANEYVEAFLPDGRILYTSLYTPTAEDGVFPGNYTQVYSTDTAGSRPKLFSEYTMENISVTPSGQLLFQDKKGYEDTWRKHHQSPITRDIWLTQAERKGRTFKKLTDFKGESRNPRWAPDGKSYYYLEETSGSLNVYRKNIDGTGEKQITNFKNHPVRYLTVSNNGTLCFSYDGALYTMREGEKPRRLDIDITVDETKVPVIRQTLTAGVTSMSVPKDEKQVAFIARGDVYVTSMDYRTTKRITNTAEAERSVSISPDGKTIVYDSERNGVWGIYKTTLVRKDDESFVYGNELKEEPLIVGKEACYAPEFSPDGKYIAYWANRTELRVYSMESKTSRTVLDGKYNFSYTDFDLSFEWSPDSRWLLTSYIGIGGWNNRDIAAVKADGTKVVNLTESGYSDGSAKWAFDGKAVIWQSDKAGYRSHGSWGAYEDIYIMFLDGETYDRFRLDKEGRELFDAKKKKEEEALKKEKEKSAEDSAKNADKDKDGKKKSADKAKSSKSKAKDDKDNKSEKDDKAKKDSAKVFVPDFDNRADRIVRLTMRSGPMGDYYLAKDGRKLYYIASYENSADLWVRDFDDGSQKVLNKGLGYGGFIPASDGKSLYMTGYNMRKVNLDNGSTKNIEFSADFDYKPLEEREYIFDHVVNLIKNKFYRADFGGVDWDFYAKSYRRFLPEISNNYDMGELLSELLGELNASHTGARAAGSGAPQQTAALGAFFDEEYDGDGLKIKEIIKNGPLDFSGSKVKTGDIVLKIDGQKIEKGKDYFPLLAGKAGRRTMLVLTDGKGKNEYEQEIKPISYGMQNSLLYKRWVNRRREFTEKYSGGKIGYVHVQAMNSESFRTVFSEVLGKNRNKEALVVDIRHNGGGWLHNDLGVLLSGKLYQTYEPRGQYIGSDPFTQWCKPSAVVMCENDYSNAHGFPFMYKTLGIGKLVGAPVAGTMTAVWWETQVNGMLVVGLPEVAVKDLKGNYLENQELEPDITVYQTPEQRIKDDDIQLKKAIDHLLGK